MWGAYLTEKGSDFIFENLPARHRLPLQWFRDHAGEIVPYPPPLPDGSLLVTRAKGICKPAGSDYALSVRQVLDGSYPDEDPIHRADGTWIYRYFQENPNPADRDGEFTNRGLIACWRDRVPVGVVRQVSGKPNVRYRVLGLAIVAGWEHGYFTLEGISPTGNVALESVEAINSSLELQSITSSFDPNDLTDARRKIERAIVARRGQPQFRETLLIAYSRCCAVTACDAVETLEAAHIVPYLGDHTNHASNGLLLRSDIHILFDLKKIAIDTSRWIVLVAPSIVGTAYGKLAGEPITVPTEAAFRPSKEALGIHRANAGL